jgi:hypothetical protein
MSIPLKSTIPESAFDELWRHRYKYRSLDGHHHILVYYETGLDGVSRAIWSL